MRKSVAAGRDRFTLPGARNQALAAIGLTGFLVLGYGRASAGAC
jgi:hypothetical protein